MIGAYLQTYYFEEIFDFLDGPQIFEIKLLELNTKNIIQPEVNQIKLVKCTREHWHMNQEILRKFKTLNVDKWLCPQIGQQLKFKGTFEIQQSTLYQYTLSLCINSTENENKCAPQETIDEKMANYTNFIFTHSFINPVINPNQKDHIQYSLNTENFVVVSKEIGAEAWIYFQDYTILTDSSILPFQDIIIEKGFISQDKFFKTSLKVPGGKYLSNVFFAKSKNTLTFKREFRKISAVISYIGGYVGAMIIVLFLVKYYTDSALEINISLDLFEINRENNQELNQENGQKKEELPFNFINFISMNIYRLVKSFSIGDKFVVAKDLVKYEQEIQKHLDIKLLLKRLIKLEYCINHILSEADIETIKSKFVSYQGAKYHRNLLNEDQKDKYSKQQRREFREKDRLSLNRRSTAIQVNNAGDLPLNSQEVILKNSQQDYHGLQIILNGYLKDSLPSSENNSKI